MRRRSRQALAMCALLACAAPTVRPPHAHAASPAASPAFRSPHASSAATAHQLVDQMLQLLNADRAQAGLDPLTLDRRLTWLALSHSRDMVVRHYFGHAAPGDQDAMDRFDRAGIPYTDAGENLGQAGGQPLTVEIDALNAAMMAEPLDGTSHHDVIVDPGLHRVGIGICIEPGNTVYLTEDFTN